ncbi:DNA mismatch repair protein MutS [Pelagicoccus sp. SDUM812005]|uniref:DNA mismatch repair protein MutS n=1 Tax=Pelagicoccus sp. SDUM812005 TaxID=3041257 RepID=UPI00280D359E|nr:DNA mismatch repair protein MutS [Pelagicoccus sp. SDUM812005]MDQ8179017.1 DNA mismatch repair protein MutS [Pelagicoccus sp. SDUM812005]
MPREKKMTPMMQQYYEVRKTLPANTLLLFRLGDFYEMFHEDAEIGAQVLGITLTKRSDYKMAGIPFHAAEQYIGKVLAANMKVAICEQVETPQAGKLVKRALTRILTPGTTIEDNQLDSQRNHYLAAIEYDKSGFSLAWIDLSTGEFRIAHDSKPDDLLPVLVSIDPAELLLMEGTQESWQKQSHNNPVFEELIHFANSRSTSEQPGFQFDCDSGAQAVMETLGVINLEGFGIEKTHDALGCAGALLHYARETLRSEPKNLSSIREYSAKASLLIDPATLRNLEIFKSTRGLREGSLIEAINGCKTAAGARLLEQWLIAPERDIPELQRRLDSVEQFYRNPMAAAELQSTLKSVRDIKRILSRMQNRLRNPRELGGVRDTLLQIPELKANIQEVASSTSPDSPAASPLDDLTNRLHELPALAELLDRALKEELPSKLDDGGYIATGYDPELDRMLSLTTDNKVWLADLEADERARTGIKNLKVKYNGAFGYFIEVTKSNLSLVPENYIRKQTTVNAERFITEDLKAKEKEIFHAEENSKRREEELFLGLIEAVLEESAALTQTAEALAELDVFCGWAEIARRWDYCKPELNDSDLLEINQGRHPVVEQMLRKDTQGLAGSHAFVPNDIGISASENQIHLITGPNMAGKSTFIRQVALITLMAQVGCWVPATSAKIGLVDRIFSRVGASDDLARGNSTFMVEMNETANILNNATENSLIILDEIGRGTSTYDGLSIAWSVIEHLHRDPQTGPKTLFATHYQELTQLDKHLGRLENYSVAVKEWNDDIVFVRQVVKGAADRSYGIQVARLAGLPTPVIDRAKEILEKLESDDSSVTVSSPTPVPVAKPRKKIKVETDKNQLGLF